MNVLFIGDIFGKAGREIVIDLLSALKTEYKIDFCIANGENIAQGRGVTERTALRLFDAGIDVFTSGNHLWDKRESIDYLKTEKRILKPINYPDKAIGNDYYIITGPNGNKLAIVCVNGQAFMGPVDSPFAAMDKYLPRLKQETNNILVDFHAEATAEKRALGFYLEGKVSAVIGTHTHIQTADEEILPGGTAYITDVGMTGPHDSVIGVKKELILEKLTSGMPKRYEPAHDGLQINAVVIRIDDESGKAMEIIRIKREIS